MLAEGIQIDTPWVLGVLAGAGTVIAYLFRTLMVNYERRAALAAKDFAENREEERLARKAGSEKFAQLVDTNQTHVEKLVVEFSKTMKMQTETFKSEIAAERAECEKARVEGRVSHEVNAARIGEVENALASFEKLLGKLCGDKPAE